MNEIYFLLTESYCEYLSILLTMKQKVSSGQENILENIHPKVQKKKKKKKRLLLAGASYHIEKASGSPVAGKE